MNVPIGMTEDGVPVYELPPHIIALLSDESACVMASMGGCSGAVVDRRSGKLTGRFCEAHAVVLP